MGPRPIGSFAASGTTLDAIAAAAWCVQYSINQESFQAATLPLPLGLFIPLAFGDAFQIVPMLFCVIRSNLKKNFSSAINTRERVLKVNLHYT